MPDSLGQLTQLRNLNLSNNQLTTLPDSLRQLTQLRNLNLSNNILTTLPDSLGQLTQLQTLNLSANRLTTLSDSLGLHRVATYAGDYRWLCKQHYDAWQPNIPNVIPSHD